jgi:catechol 2,3-dioxygenase-like lactoylglutathione lyase family enzyme
MAETQTKAAAECRMISPQFVVPDVVAAAEYYRDILGFRILGYFLDPPVYAIVARDSVESILERRRQALPPHPTSGGGREASTPTFG